jgi:hypothetical protein
MNPFNHPNVTCEDVISLIDLGYELSPDDRRDIAYNMHPSELFKLWDGADITLHIGHLQHNPHIDNNTLEKLGRISRDPRDRRIQDKRTVRVLSRCMDISEILKHPSLPWCREELSKNESVTLEMIPLIEETLTNLRSYWDKEAIDSITKGLTLDIALRLGINSPVLTGIRDIVEFIEPYYYRREDLERITGRKRREGIPKIYERLIRLGHWNVIRNSTKPMRIVPHMYDITVMCSN